MLWKKAGAAAVLTLFLLFFSYYENHHLVITEYVVEDVRVPDGFDGYRLVQLSDLHNQKFGSGNANLIKKVTDLSPDGIVLTGDIVDSNHTNLQTAVQLCRELTKICPVYYVTGNHEYWLTEEERRELFDGLASAGVNIMENNCDMLPAGKGRKDGEDCEGILLVGLDDKSLFGSTLGRLTKELPDETFKLVLAHEPQYFSEYERGGADLVLSGHAHGGQFILPLAGPVVAPDQGFFPKLTSGLHTSGNTRMIISRGLGNSVIPVRLFNDPEIVLVILKEKRQ